LQRKYDNRIAEHRQYVNMGKPPAQQRDKHSKGAKKTGKKSAARDSKSATPGGRVVKPNGKGTIKKRMRDVDRLLSKVGAARLWLGESLHPERSLPARTPSVSNAQFAAFLICPARRAARPGARPARRPGGQAGGAPGGAGGEQAERAGA
jgi:hypothetical protein